MKKLAIITTIFFVLVLLGALFVFSGSNSEAEISSFAECVEAGNPVMESYPRQCRTDDGRLFVEEISPQPGEVLIVSGEVVEIDSSEVPVDGPYVVSLETNTGESREIAVPSMGINLCPAQENIVSVSDLSAGDQVEARGRVESEGRIVLCDSPDDYLEIEPSGEMATTTIGVGEVGVVRGVSIHLNEVVQESRCPVDAECIEAGAVTVNVTLGYEGETETRNIASDDVAYEFAPANRSVAITGIAPPLRSGEEIAQEEYMITFSVE